jgi:hypothetical protein
MIGRLFSDAVLPTNFSVVKLYAKVVINGNVVFGESAVISSEIESLIRLDMGLLKEASIGRNFRINYLQAQVS